MASGNSKLKWALGISLAVNVFALSAGGAFWGYKHFRPKAPEPVTALTEAVEGLSPATGQKLITAVRAAALASEADMEAAWELRKQAAEVAKTEPYDGPKIMVLLAQARDLEIKGKVRIEQTLVDQAAALPPAERAIVADRFIKSSFKLRRLLFKAQMAEKKAREEATKAAASATGEAGKP
ncbi:periplasmic heavy metal sensor [Asticcacaulis sp. ZE23SCel15]|uniref:periplasmic heavy metal sensor n=1 Tax=Asticcacaulis sp. ZE23SCel15 TaxID=3059027 RepID=UPI00265FF9B3|nr:periplasmic heavy metal sensor [Asticcacaulis sp. ZE23SCel15]WKL57692.1 periplasmic heavy metal sensor [Asticcacaulis sp. ZE23SCel15]